MWSMVFIAFGTFAGFSAQAASASCYQFERTDSPGRESSAAVVRSETWCYRNLENAPGSRMVFNVDGLRTRPEMSILVEPGGFLTHASLLAGELTVHKVRSDDFNPFQIPLEEPHGLEPVLLPSDAGLERSVEEAERVLRGSGVSMEVLNLREGSIRASVPPRALPWRGFWWPYRNQTISGRSDSPLAKYDRFVQASTGRNPGAAVWENQRNRYKGVHWEGHCNGWAAASILRAEPRAPRRDPVSGVVFTVSDQKGILSENDYCVQHAFFGSRNRGRATDDARDIRPDLFHQTLQYYIGQLGKPVAFDYNAGSSVDNHVISGYQMDIRRTGAGRFAVVTRVTVHGYDSSKIEIPGVAPTYERTYRYNLFTDASGRLTGGSWSSANPDFLWVPLSPRDCSTHNPRVVEEWTARIMRLPLVR